MTARKPVVIKDGKATQIPAGDTLEGYSKASDINTALGLKVDKVTGKQLSTNDYTTEEKNKLGGVATGATANRSDAATDLLLAGKVGTGDARLTDAREWTAATIPQAEAEGGYATTRRAWTSQRVKQAFTAFFGAISSSLGRTLIGRATPALMRTDLELGTAATRNVGTGTGHLMEVGAYGVGVIQLLPSLTPPSGFYMDTRRISGGKPPSWVPGGSYTSYLSLGSSTETLGMGLVYDVNLRKLYVTGDNPTGVDGIFSNPREIYHTGNTTVLGTGAIHVASPILKLKTDSFEVEGFTKDCNPAATRKSKGVYEITGTQGLRSDGWYIETPKDRNGNKYFNVEWSQNIEQPLAEIETPVDGIVVTLSVFERAWNPATGIHENGAPIDINDLQSRWIDLRFNEVIVKHIEPLSPEEPVV